jgi:hypothetical protein
MPGETIRLGPITIIDNGDGVIHENDRFLGPFVPGPYGGRGIDLGQAEARLQEFGVPSLEGRTVEDLRRLQPRVNRLWRAEQERPEGNLWDSFSTRIGDLFEAIGEPIDGLIVGAAGLLGVDLEEGQR